MVDVHKDLLLAIVSKELSCMQNSWKLLNYNTILLVKAHQCSFISKKYFGINFREFDLLLLSSYGTTLGEIKIEDTI